MINLETVDLNCLLIQLEGGGQELHNLLTLIALELENASEFFVLVDVAIAAKVLLEGLQDTLQVIFCRIPCTVVMVLRPLRC